MLRVPSSSFSASLDRDEAVLRFPYDDRLRRLLRAIPGRRWDPDERAWLIPLDPDRAEALARLFANAVREPLVSDPLRRAIVRRRRRRRGDECLLDLARPDENWWLGFATDAAPVPVAALLEHPDAYCLPLIGRGLIPLDEHAAVIIDALGATSGLRLSELARKALRARDERTRAEGRAPLVHAARDRAPAERTSGWRGHVEVTGPSEEPVFLLLGDVARLPPALREQAASAPGGAAVPLSLDSWRLIEAPAATDG